MNEWSRRTLEIVNNENYLDKLQRIYPNIENPPRTISAETKSLIRRSFDERNCESLLNTLLDLKKFPFKDSYVAFLRKDRDAIARNPETANRICNNLYNMGFRKIIKGITQPKEANTQRGPQYRNWLRARFLCVDINAFRTSTESVVILKASERAARDFCNREMGVGISKQPDMVAKSGTRYVIGEAKFLSSSGGNQGRAFDDGMTLATNNQGSAFKVFVLDGIHWIDRGSDQYRRIEYGTAAVFSALLLEEFLESI